MSGRSVICSASALSAATERFLALRLSFGSTARRKGRRHSSHSRRQNSPATAKLLIHAERGARFNRICVLSKIFGTVLNHRNCCSLARHSVPPWGKISRLARNDIGMDFTPVIPNQCEESIWRAFSVRSKCRIQNLGRPLATPCRSSRPDLRIRQLLFAAGFLILRGAAEKGAKQFSIRVGDENSASIALLERLLPFFQRSAGPQGRRG